MIKRALTSLLLTAMLMLVGANATADKYADAWQQPLQMTLPEPMRNVLLASMVDAGKWVATNGIEDARLVRQGRQTLVQFAMSDDNWSQQEGQLCQQTGVSACETSTCQAIQFNAEATNARDAEAVKARIVKNAPELDAIEADDEAGGMCTAAPLPALAANEAGAGTNLALDLDLRGRSSPGSRRGNPLSAQSSDVELGKGIETDVERVARGGEATGAQGAPAQQGAPLQETTGPREAAKSPDVAATEQQATAAATEPDPSAAPADPYTASEAEFSSADFQLQVASNFADGANLSTNQLPADTSDYTLLVGEGCQSVSVPMSSVAPAHVPNLLVALVNTSTATIAGRYGLSVVSESTLASTGETLAVFMSVHPLQQILPLLLLDRDVLVAEREHIFTTTADASLEPAPSYSDPLAQFTYGPKHTGALALHASATGAGQTVAVIDTGVALDHPDLAGRIEHEDFTGKGWSADAHGTAVAGIIAAEADNGLGSYGVAPQAKILALKACQPNSATGLAAKCWTSSLVKALDAAMQRDAQIINMSLAGPPDRILARYVELAVQQNRMIIAGAGNGGAQARPAFPAALPGVLAVTAIDTNNAHYQSANRGDYIDVAAPGVDIVTLAPDGSFPMSSGTSWAAAHVSGVAALMASIRPLMNASEMNFLLSRSSRDLGTPGQDDRFGHGVVDACATAAAATSSEVTCGPTVENDYAQR